MPAYVLTHPQYTHMLISVSASNIKNTSLLTFDFKLQQLMMATQKQFYL